jgi:rapamycin-insensitive companion of mTOR
MYACLLVDVTDDKQFPVLIDIDLVSRTGGVRFLLQALGDGPVELTPILASTFLHLVDSPRTRPYFNLGTDLELALSPVTDAYGKGTDHIERMKNCAKVIQLILRNWSGKL